MSRAPRNQVKAAPPAMVVVDSTAIMTGDPHEDLSPEEAEELKLFAAVDDRDLIQQYLVEPGIERFGTSDSADWPPPRDADGRALWRRRALQLVVDDFLRRELAKPEAVPCGRPPTYKRQQLQAMAFEVARLLVSYGVPRAVAREHVADAFGASAGTVARAEAMYDWDAESIGFASAENQTGLNVAAYIARLRAAGLLPK